MKDALAVASNILKAVTLYRGFYRSQEKISGPKMIDYAQCFSNLSA